LASDRVLLVEDDETYGRALRRVIAAQGGAVTWTRSVAETRVALDTSTSAQWNLAIIDDRLPDGSGVDLLRLLSARQAVSAAALVTAFFSAARALEVHHSGWLLFPKPVTPNEIQQLLTAIAAGSSRFVPRSHHYDHGTSTALSFGSFTLGDDGLKTPTGCVPLVRATERAVLTCLCAEEGRIVETAEIAKRVFGRRDRAALVLVRRHVANLRVALGPYAWIIESRARRGYRVAPRAFDAYGQSA
jgi:DNA-binding response OmpR family regulator